MSAVERRDDCRLCHGTELDLVLQLTPTPLADDYVPASSLDEPQPVYPLDLYLCRTCGFVQLLHVVQPKAIYLDYIYETTSSLGLVDHFEDYAADVLERIGPPSGSLVVDIGSNDGTLLRSFQRRGMRVLGIDPAREIARRATESGIDTLPEFFDIELARRVREDYGPAAIITANNVIANIDDLDEVTAAARELLGPDGVFVFESYYLGDLVRNLVFDFIYHEHISSFAVAPLERFFAGNGMTLIDVLPVPTKGGSLRYTVQAAGGPRPVAPAVGELREQERRQGLATPELFRDFERRIDLAKSDLLSYLDAALGDGTQLAGYGASATTTTLVYHFDLGDRIEYFVDEYPAKQGLFSPGLHIPVLSPDALYERRPELVLVTAWRYHEPIAQKHAAFLDHGGRFVVPMPQLRVIETRERAAR